MAEYETVTSYPVVDQAREAARNYGHSFLNALSTAYQSTLTCFRDTLAYCIPSFQRPSSYGPTYDWEDDTDAQWSDELERLLDTEGHSGEDATNALSTILSRLPFIRGTAIPYKPSAANLRRARNKSRSSIHSNGSVGTGESLRSRTELFDHSGDEFEDAGMLPDERIFALTSSNPEEANMAFIGQTEVELQEEDRLTEQREEALLQIKRERAQRLAVKRGLSDTLGPSERPKSSGQNSLRDAIPLRRGRSSTLQSQLSDKVPLRGRSSTLGSQSSGIPSEHVEHDSPLRNSQMSPNASNPPLESSSSFPIDQEPPSTGDMNDETEFSEFVQAEIAEATEPAIPMTYTPPRLPQPVITPLTTISTVENEPSSPTPPSNITSPSNPSPRTPSSSPRPKRTPPEHPLVRKTSSKVPGDYDPITGYYRRKSDADVRVDEEDQVVETWKQSIDSLGKD